MPADHILFQAAPYHISPGESHHAPGHSGDHPRTARSCPRVRVLHESRDNRDGGRFPGVDHLFGAGQPPSPRIRRGGHRQALSFASVLQALDRRCRSYFKTGVVRDVETHDRTRDIYPKKPDLHCKSSFGAPRCSDAHNAYKYYLSALSTRSSARRPASRKRNSKWEPYEQYCAWRQSGQPR